MEALPLEEEKKQRRDLQRAFGVTPEEVGQAQWQRSTRDHWSLDPTSAAGGSGPSLHEVGGGDTHGLSRPVADTARLRQVVQVFRDAAKEASTGASDGTPAPGCISAVASALAAAKGHSPLSASAAETAAPGPGSDTHGRSSRDAGGAGVAPALEVAATRRGRSPRSRSRQAPAARTPRDGALREPRRRRSSRRDKSPPSSDPPPQRRASTARRARPPPPVGRTRTRAAAAPPQPSTAVVTTRLPAVDGGLARPRSARSGPWCRRRCVPSGGSSGRTPWWPPV